MRKACTTELPLLQKWETLRSLTMQENVVMMLAFVHPPARTDCRGGEGGRDSVRKGKGVPDMNLAFLFQVLSEFDTSLHMHMVTISEHC